MKDGKARRCCLEILCNNKGSTLIEVIVCVLIIGVAFVPLMAGMSASLRANRETENRLHAENVASNIVEICKTYGEQGLDKLKDFNSDTENGIKAFLAGDSVAISKMGAGKFKITNIASGEEGKEFWANIEFNGAKYENYLKNEDGNYLDKDGNVVIDTGSGFEDESGTPIVGDPRVPMQNNFTGYQTIAGLTEAVIISLDEDDLTTIVTKIHDKLASKQTGTPTIDQMKASASNWLRRRIVIETREATIDGKTRYEVVGKVQYIANKDTNVIKDSSIESVIYQTRPFEQTIINYSVGSPDVDPLAGSSNNIKNYGVPPKSIIVTYSDLKDDSGNYIDFMPSILYDMEIEKYTSGFLNVYCMCADAPQVIARSHKLLINVSGTEVYGITPFEEDGSGGETFYYVSAYSNLNSIDGDYQNCNKLDAFGEGSSGKQSKIKDVKVSVWEYDNTVESTNKVLEKDSTVIEFE